MPAPIPSFPSSARATIRRVLLALLALPLLSLPLLLLLAPEDTHDHPRYMTLRHPYPTHARSSPPSALVVPLGTDVPVGAGPGLLEGGGGGGGEVGDDEETQEEAVAKEREAQKGEEETEKMRAKEEEHKKDNRKEKEQASSSSSSSSSWPPPSWAWPLHADHVAYGAKRFGIQFPPTAPSSSSTCTGGEGEEVDFTLVSQTSPDRLWMLGHICQRWQGPIILAVFTRGYTAEHDAMVDRIYCPQACLLRVRPPPPGDGEGEGIWGSPDQFPVNALR